MGHGETGKFAEMRHLIISFSILSCLAISLSIGTEPPKGQRCKGRNYNGQRCCTPENPCGLGEGDCDGPLDGGRSDGDRGCKGYHHHLPLVRDVQGGTIMDKDVAPLITPVVRERVTVMAVVMGGGVMVIEGARVTWYVVETTARSLVLTTMRRMTVVRSLAIKDGVTGVAGHLVTVGTNRGSAFARGSSVIWQQRTNKRKLARLEDSTDDYSVYHFRTTNLFYTSILHLTLQDQHMCF